MTSTADANPMIIAGGFTSYGGSTSSARIVSLTLNGARSAFISKFSPTASSNILTVNKIAMDGSGAIYAAGVFTTYNQITANRILKVDKNGDAITSFTSGTGFDVSLTDVDILIDGYQFYIGGNFNSYNGTTCSRIVKLNSDGTIDSSFNIGTGLNVNAGLGYVRSITKNTSDNKIYVAGKFDSYNGVTQSGLVRLNTDGSLDTSFNTGASGFPVTSTIINKTIVDSSGKIYVLGAFNSYNGTSFTGITGNNKMIRLNSDGSRDATFSTKSFYGANDSILYAAALDSAGKIYVGGGFQTYDGTNVYSIVRLNSDGSKDTTFNTGSGFDIGFHTSAPDAAVVYDLYVDYADNLYVCGLWTSYSGTTSVNLIKLKSTGAIDTSFVVPTSGSNNAIKSMKVITLI